MKKNATLTFALAMSLSILAGTTAFAAPITEENARNMVTPYLPSASSFLYSEVDDGCLELKYLNKAAKEGYKWKLNQESGNFISVESEKFDSRGGSNITLSEEAAKKLVISEIADAQILSVTIDRDDDIEYEISFKTESYYGKYNIHPETGVILEREITFDRWKEGKPSGNLITRDKAIELAKKQVSDAVVTDVDLDWEASVYCYEIELKKDGVEYTVLINASTGDVIKTYEDKDDWHKDRGSQTSGTQGSQDIGIERAKQIALALVPGGIICKCEPDHDDGKFIYEVELKKDNWEYEIEIDGKTGEVLKNEKDFDD